MSSSAEAIRAQKQFLETVFTKKTLEDPRQKHPAAVRWQLCVKLLQQGGSSRWPTQKAELPLLATMMLDAFALVKISGGDLQTFSLGNFSGYGDEGVQRKIKSRVNDYHHFQDLMAELSVAAWHQSEGHSVIPFEKEGWCDLKIVFAADDLPILLECKRIHVPTITRLAKHITKANKQIRQTCMAAYGVVVLDVTMFLSKSEQVLSDETPREIAAVVEPIRAMLSGPKNRSIGRVLLTWDEAGIVGTPPDRTLAVLRRSIRAIDHEPSVGVFRLPDTAPAFQGSTAWSAIDWDQSGERIERLRPSNLMKECKQWFSFTNEELIDSFVHYDKWQRIMLDENHYFILFARRSPDKSSFILAVASREGTVLNLQFALRTPPSLYNELDLLTAHEMLEFLVSKYGLEVTVGGISSRFIAQRRIELAEGDMPSFGVKTNQGDSALLFALVKMVERRAKSSILNCAFVFALDKTRLSADLPSKPGEQAKKEAIN